MAIGHATVDFYQGAVPTLVPFLVAERHYGYAAASGIVLAATLLSSMVAGVVLTASAIRSLARRGAAEQAAARGTGRDNWPEFLRLSAVIVCRSIVYVGLSAFIALYAQQRVPGGSATGSAALFTLFAGGAVGTVLG
ncbi:hypothetical protein AB4Z54_17085, partial [Streptomyces sp. MCAF7]